jgi:hypothetical protein
MCNLGGRESTPVDLVWSIICCRVRRARIIRSDHKTGVVSTVGATFRAGSQSPSGANPGTAMVTHTRAVLAQVARLIA